MKKFQVTGIGNAMVDVLARTDDAFLESHGIDKGVMQLIDKDRATDLYAHVGVAQQVSGGSAANTIAGIAHLGGRTAYVGKVRDDQLGEIFAHDLRAQGAAYDTPMASADTVQETGRCIVCVTPDGERSMNTYLGVSETLGPNDIDEALMAESDWIYLEGYRFDGPDSHAAFEKAITACKAAGGRVALTLSDPFCVERHREAFRRLIADHVDLLFANRMEILSMYETADLDAALLAASGQVEIIACTDSEKGAHVMSGGERWHIPALLTEIQDATGAGDLFAAGFLWGIVNGQALEQAGRMGCIAASEIIGHVGARPEQDLKNLFHQHGVI